MKKIKQFIALAMSFMAASSLFAMENPAAIPTPATISVDAAETAAAISLVATVNQSLQQPTELSQEELMLKAAKTLPSAMLVSYFTGAAFAEGKESGLFKGIKNLMNNAYQSTVNATASVGSYLYNGSVNATASVMDYAKKGTILAQIADYIGSYGEPQSAESLYDAMQTVNATCNTGVMPSAETLDKAMCTIGEALGLMPTNEQWLQQHPHIAQGAKVTALVAAAAITYWMVHKLIKKYQKK